jgi:hypothetical protein
MNSDYYEAKQEAMIDFITEHSENCENAIDDILDLLIFLQFDVLTLGLKSK